MKITLNNLPFDRLYIGLNSEINSRITNKVNERFGSPYVACKHLNLKLSFYRWLKQGRYPLSVLMKLIELANVQIEDIEDSTIEVRSGRFPTKGGNLSEPIFIKFPIMVSKPLARIIAHLIGDGHVSISKKGYLNIAYYNTNKELLNNFEKDSFEIFGVRGIRGVNKDIPFIRLPSPVGVIMLKIAGTFNSKECRVPDFIKNANEEIKAEFLKALFDDEASVRYSPPYRHIELTLVNKPLLEDIKALLESVEIKCTPIYRKVARKQFIEYYFYIRNYNNFTKFYEKVGFSHPTKQDKLNAIISDPGRKSYSHGETKKLILDYLNKKTLTTKDLARLLERKEVTITWFLLKLKSENKVEPIGFKNKYKIWRIKNG